MLKGPTGPAYAAEMERVARKANPDTYSRRPAWFSVPNLIAFGERVIDGHIERLNHPEGRSSVFWRNPEATGGPEDCADRLFLRPFALVDSRTSGVPKGPALR